MPYRRITFAGSCIAVEYSGPRSTQLVDFLFGHAPADGDLPAHVTYHLLENDKTAGLKLYRDETLLYSGENEAELAELWLGDACYHLADRSQGGLLLHAAALTWQGRGLILPGVSGAGKTTLTAWLLSQGFDYLTDELVFVLTGADTLQAFTRPLNLKADVRATLAQLVQVETQFESILSSSSSLLVPPVLLKSGNTLSEPPLDLIIFPRYCACNRFDLRPLSRARAGMFLMECLINARNLPDHGFAEIARLCRQTPAYQMSYGKFSSLTGQIEAILTAEATNSLT